MVSSQFSSGHFPITNNLLVDGYKQKNAYILGQAPMSETTLDFWRLVWQTKSSVVVLLTPVEDSKTAARRACIDFWPQTGDSQFMGKEKKLQVKTLTFTYGPGYDQYRIEVGTSRGKYHTFTLLQYHRWRDDERIPDDLVKFSSRTRVLGSNGNMKTPMIVLCANVSLSSYNSGEH